MKEVILDTETTGLSVRDGHRIVEIGCIELENLIPTKNRFHCYLNPEKKVSEKHFAEYNYDFVKKNWDEFCAVKKSKGLTDQFIALSNARLEISKENENHIIVEFDHLENLNKFKKLISEYEALEAEIDEINDAYSEYLKIGKQLEKLPGVKVIYTRKTDVFVELIQRANIANSKTIGRHGYVL